VFSLLDDSMLKWIDVNLAQLLDFAWYGCFVVTSHIHLEMNNTQHVVGCLVWCFLSRWSREKIGQWILEHTSLSVSLENWKDWRIDLMDDEELF
jgi:hypothetical protein